ncbi:MAG: RNA polymerase sigma factor [Jatrophihabitans sp.]|uniref:RNA polymerase sigma factor n=1 Tax=Jatrophihabitans sp. TaxID=1932789 RepID=UPI003F7D0650
MLNDDDAWSWVHAAAAGDSAAFGRLYEEYAGEIHRFVRRRTISAELAEDLTQDTFVRALRAIGTVTDQGRPVAAWLVTIARNLILDHAKSARTAARCSPTRPSRTAPGCAARRTASSRSSTVGRSSPRSGT